jgi:hypothetical protein
MGVDYIINKNKIIAKYAITETAWTIFGSKINDTLAFGTICD